MSDAKEVSIMVADYEIPTKLFIEIVKYIGGTGVWASPSHSQTHPDEINYSAILKWRHDENGLFALTKSMKTVRLSPEIPAMKLVLVEDRNTSN